MRRWTNLVGAVLASAWLTACAKPSGSVSAAAAKADVIALAHATVIDVASGDALPDRTVLISGDRITEVAASSELATPRGATVIDATGKWIIPGLWDMHVHFADPESGPLFVANGVTGVRVMWGNWHFVKNPDGTTGDMPAAPGDRLHFELRDAYERGEKVGPRMVISSDILDGPKSLWPGSVPVATKEEARRAVRDAKEHGADFIKIYSLIPRDAFFALAEESRAQGLTLAGHVPESVTIAEASDAGQGSVEHLTGAPMACSSRADALMREQAEFMKTMKEPYGFWRMRRRHNLEALSNVDVAKRDALFAKFVANGTWQCPTLVSTRAAAFFDQPERIAPADAMRYVSPSLARYWDPQVYWLARGRTTEDYELARAAYPKILQLVGAMQRAGVPILAGSDETNPYCFAGIGLHQELELLVDAGLTPIEALRAATANPARFLGRESTMGSIAAGKDADLVILDADPRADITRTRGIWAVVSRGTVYDRQRLDGILAQAAH